LSVHIVIPDTQVRPGVPLLHFDWIGQYCKDLIAKYHDTKVHIVHLGDHHDMFSLSSHAKARQLEGKRYWGDIESGNQAIEILSKYIWPAPSNVYQHVLMGNHEDRITRFQDNNPQLTDAVSMDHFDWHKWDWKIYPFLTPVFIDGVGYAHYWYRPLSGKSYTGTIENRLKLVGHSFTQGHEQTLLYGLRHVNTQKGYRSQHGLVAGACYLHDEDYKGPQGNAHWRGIIVCHEVSKGSYDPMFVSLNYLCQRYEGRPISSVARKVKGASRGLY
jgi:hypothetical protein